MLPPRYEPVSRYVYPPAQIDQLHRQTMLGGFFLDHSEFGRRKRRGLVSSRFRRSLKINRHSPAFFLSRVAAQRYQRPLTDSGG